MLFLGHGFIHNTNNSYNMDTRDLPDMYAQNSRAAGPRAEGIHISQITRAHVTSNCYNTSMRFVSDL